MRFPDPQPDMLLLRRSLMQDEYLKNFFADKGISMVMVPSDSLVFVENGKVMSLTLSFKKEEDGMHIMELIFQKDDRMLASAREWCKPQAEVVGEDLFYDHEILCCPTLRAELGKNLAGSMASAWETMIGYFTHYLYLEKLTA